jgi:hypothetical protein
MLIFTSFGLAQSPYKPRSGSGPQNFTINTAIKGAQDMATIYTVEAYSPSLHQTVRQFDLANIVNEQLTQQQADVMAQRFAEVQNQNFYMHTCDWQPLVKLQTVGVETIDGYIKR